MGSRSSRDSKAPAVSLRFSEKEQLLFYFSFKAPFKSIDVGGNRTAGTYWVSYKQSDQSQHQHSHRMRPSVQRPPNLSLFSFFFLSFFFYLSLVLFSPRYPMQKSKKLVHVYSSPKSPISYSKKVFHQDAPTLVGLEFSQLIHHAESSCSCVENYNLILRDLI